MKEIFDLQRKLNVFTLEKIGVDFETAITDGDQKLIWIENYRKALSAELAELVREVEAYGLGTQNGRVEVVDILHFLVSLSHIVQIEATDVSFNATGGSSFEANTIRTFLALDDLQNSLKWKWWAKGGGFKPEKAKKAVLELWKCFGEMCGLNGMDLETVRSIYVAKNRVNFDRQNTNYNEDTKTEADNLSIPAPSTGYRSE